jgi:hypothetical protein
MIHTHWDIQEKLPRAGVGSITLTPVVFESNPLPPASTRVSEPRRLYCVVDYGTGPEAPLGTGMASPPGETTVSFAGLLSTVPACDVETGVPCCSSGPTFARHSPRAKLGLTVLSHL